MKPISAGYETLKKKHLKINSVKWGGLSSCRQIRWLWQSQEQQGLLARGLLKDLMQVMLQSELVFLNLFSFWAANITLWCNFWCYPFTFSPPSLITCVSFAHFCDVDGHQVRVLTRSVSKARSVFPGEWQELAAGKWRSWENFVHMTTAAAELLILSDAGDSLSS